MSNWSQLVQYYRVAQSHLPLTTVGWAMLGSAPFGVMRNALAVASDAYGLVLQKSGLLGGDETVYIPWAHMRRGEPPQFLIPIGTFPRETFLIGQAQLPLTLPQGMVRAPG
jgi:hypothetical protein